MGIVSSLEWPILAPPPPFIHLKVLSASSRGPSNLEATCVSLRGHAGWGAEALPMTSSLGFCTDPTRIYRMPEDQVAKRGTTVQLECRVKHDPSLKLTVSWLKDDEPLYIGNRFLCSFLLSSWCESGPSSSSLLSVTHGGTRGQRTCGIVSPRNCHGGGGSISTSPSLTSSPPLLFLTLFSLPFSPLTPLPPCCLPLLWEHPHPQPYSQCPWCPAEGRAGPSRLPPGC